jgi:hypothetical protein
LTPLSGLFGIPKITDQWPIFPRALRRLFQSFAWPKLLRGAMTRPLSGILFAVRNRLPGCRAVALSKSLGSTPYRMHSAFCHPSLAGTCGHCGRRLMSLVVIAE